MVTLTRKKAVFRVHGATKKLFRCLYQVNFIVKIVFSDTESKIEKNPNGIINTA